MHSQDSLNRGSPEASSFLRRPEDLRRFLDDIIRVATAAKSLLETCGGPLEASKSCVQPPPTSDSRSPRRTYSFRFFCGQTGHIQANCGPCKQYLAAGKCLLVKGRVVLPTGQEIPREVPGRTLKDRLDSWDLGNRSKVPVRAPSTPLSSSDASLCRPRSPSHTLPTSYSRGRPQSRSRSRGRSRPHSPSRSHLENSPSRSSRYVHSYLSGSHSCRSRSRDHRRRSPPPAPLLGCSRLPTLSRDNPDLDRLSSQLVSRLASYSTRSSYSSHAPAHSRRSRSRSRTPQPSRRVY
ncbi:hypothetical protein BKA83DRAFT_231576 [Pisolithus microcarpus]|nr:hypothetical protein BKA83DRAFT_231576 [Pisolithus microcarpus]